MCIFSLSLIQNPSPLWIITARAESEPAKVSGKNPTLFYKHSKQIWICVAVCFLPSFFFFHFFFFFSTIPLHVILFEYLSMNEFSEGVVHKKSLGRSSAGVQLAAVTLHSVTSWKCITVNVKSSLVGYSPQCSHQLSQLKDFRYWVRGPNNSMGLTPSN